MFDYQEYLIRRKILTFFGAKLHVFDAVGDVAAFVHMKAFKLKEDIRVYSDETMGEEVFRINARQIIDFSAAYDVTDAAGTQIGALRRRGLKSILRDEWIILDAADNEVGLIQEESGTLAFLRRFVDFVSLLVPQKYHGYIGGEHVMDYKQNFNPFVMKLRLSFLPEASGRISPALAVAAGILLCVIEGKQR